MKTSIVLRNESKATGLSSIYIEYSNYPKVKRFPTQYKVPKSYWNAETQKIKKDGTEDYKAANSDLQEKQAKIERLIKDFFTANNRYPSCTELGNIYEPTITPVTTSPAKTFNDYLKEYLEIKTAKLKPNSLKQIKSLIINLIDFQKVNNLALTFDSINNQLLDKFVSYLSDKQYHNTTTGRRITALKELLNYYATAGINTNTNYKSYSFKVKRAKNEEVVTLTGLELEALKQLDLTGNQRLERVRDLFVLQCWTGLRYSDVVRLNKTHIKDGYVKIDILKTEDYSEIPLFPVAQEILEKYGYEIKRISNDKYNEYLKQVSQLVPDLHKPITQIHYSGNKRIETTKPKWELIATHTARRTFVTLCLENEVNPAQIMKWSNHSNIRIFQKYINNKQGEQREVNKLLAGYQHQVQK